MRLRVKSPIDSSSHRGYLTFLSILMLALVMESMWVPSFAQDPPKQNQAKGSFWSHLWNDIGEWIQGEPYDGHLPLRVQHTKSMIGIGTVGIEDSYLSEVVHNGLYGTILIQTDYPLETERDKWHVYTEAQGKIGLPTNQANGGEMIVTGGRVSTGAVWRGLNWQGLTLDLAPLVTAHLQADLKLTNTNNVTNIKGDLGLDAWTRLRYRLPLSSFPIKLQYSLRMPLIQVSFSPDYGQSYYEYVAGGEESTKIRFYPTSFHNNLELQQLFTVDLPIRHLTVTLGAEHHYRQSSLSNLTFRQGSWVGLVGVSVDILSLSGNRSRDRHLIQNSLD